MGQCSHRILSKDPNLFNIMESCRNIPSYESPGTTTGILPLVSSLKESGELCCLPISVINAYCYYRSVQKYSHLVHVHLQEALYNTVHSLIMWFVLQ